jgi:hypothetical protein
MLPKISAARLATATLTVGVAVASAGSIDAATQTPSSTPSPSSTSSTVVPYGEHPPFTPVDPSNPNGTHIAVLRGDPAKGPSVMFMRMRKMTGRMHVHTADYDLVVIEGTMKHRLAGEDEANVKPMGVGSYWFQRGGVPHADSCLSDTCVMYVTWSGPRDGRLAEERPSPTAKQ